MALNWNISKVDNYKELTDGHEAVITDTLIWATLAVGIGNITAKNYKEFYARLHLLELLNGSFMMQDRKPAYITLADVQRRIGLDTNVGTIPRSTFLKQKVGRYFDGILTR